MTQRVIAIGDIHGCTRALRALIEVIQPRSDDTLITLGDCVDRGPDSRGVLDEMLSLRERCNLIPLLGNHEEMMLSYLDGKPQPDDWLEVGGDSTLESYRKANKKLAPPSDEHVEYIRTWDDFYETPSHFFAHGNYAPERRLAEQHWQTMRWQSLKNSIPKPHISGKTAVVGHTSLKNGEVLDLGHLVCIDTYCWGGGWLTAFDTMVGHFWQVDRDGRTRGKATVPQRVAPWLA